MVGNNETLETHHQAVIATLKAQSANRVLRSLNTEGKSLRPLQKEFPSGNETDGGIALACSIRPPGEENFQVWPPLARPLVGEIPPGELFPHHVDLLAKFGHADILRLVAFYNDSFGIQLEDSLEQRVDKFRRWCMS